ncbi:uncharacterized protein [Spinacia oleracea]|uniref:Uncharacterized protein isoform X2 n=1 Tax=Spinacia oleracea TaxID=3562 RepID=A0ABM3RF78_SPIOL|nr:uncharacterized protein LOC110782433 isoform X2 [Spinacia oleracea]
MSDKKDERENSPRIIQKDERESSSTTPPTQKIRGPPPPPLFLPPSFDFEPVKRPRYAHQWKQQSPLGLQNPESSPSPSNPQAHLTSPESSSSPSPPVGHDLDPSKNEQKKQQQFRKGKYVSPVWKPHEMLWLAKAWRGQYQGGDDGGGGGSSGGGRGKTRAEKDREVAEFLNQHGVNRDAKTAGTKWDNMLGEFRKVYEWERGSEREQQVVGKSYFRLSPYERKIHRLPASFDEQVFDELSQFMGPKMRHSSSSSSLHINTSSSSSGFVHHHQQHHHLQTSLPPPHPFGRDESYPPPNMFSERTRQMQSYLMNNPRTNPLLGSSLDPHPSSSPLNVGISPTSTTSGGSPRVELRRIGRMRMTWEEWVTLWAEEGEYHNRGRVKIQGSSNLLNADHELFYFDDSMVASSLEAFEDGPLKGFSVDRFVPGQQLKVFGRRKQPLSPPPSTSSAGEFQDPTEYYLGCLRSPPTTLPTLFELSWYIQEPPPEEFRLPLRKDIYRDLPHGKDLFFTTTTTTTTSNEPSLDCKSFTIDVLSSLIRSTPSITAATSSNRDSYISLWDDCINRVISKFCPFEMVFTRKELKKKQSSSSLECCRDQWPNLTGMVKNLCLWRGEEIDQLRDSQPFIDPSSTITQKITWTYNDLPYVLGYYAIGHNITFCALSPSSSSPSQITRTNLYSLDLTNPSERVKLLVPCWRIGILLASLAEKCMNNHRHRGSCSDYERIDFGDGNVVEMTAFTVTRYYPCKRSWQSAKEIYSVLDHRVVPHAEHMVSYDEDELTLMFKPRGVKTKPKNTEQLVLALKQVAKALVALHDLSFMHRNLSWENVLMVLDPGQSKSMSNGESDQSETECEWFVAGFEEAVGAPQINPYNNRVTAEKVAVGVAPEMGRGVHGVKVDVWGIGCLIKTSEVKSEGLVGKKLKELEEKCMGENPEQRPTAADCYHHLLQIQSSLSSAASTACC